MDRYRVYCQIRESLVCISGGKKEFVPNALEVLNAKSNKSDYQNEMNDEMF